MLRPSVFTCMAARVLKCQTWAAEQVLRFEQQLSEESQKWVRRGISGFEELQDQSVKCCMSGGMQKELKRKVSLKHKQPLV